MKKYLMVIASILLICVCFVACSKANDKTTTATTTTGTTVKQITEVSTDEAKITGSDAINLIKSYTDEELGLTADQHKTCSFMVASNGTVIEKKKYINVIATVKTEHKDKDGKVTYTFDNKGSYFISFDGKEVMSQDLKTNHYTQMKVRAVPTTTKPTTHAATSTTKKK